MNKEINRIDIRQRLLDGLFEAERMRMSAEHFVSVIMPLSGDNKLLVRSLERIYSSMVLIINRVLQFEYFSGRVRLTQDKEKNLEVFLKLSKDYGLDEREIETIREILFLGKKHKESGMEFSRKKGFIILDDDLEHHRLNEKKVEDFLAVERKLIVLVGNKLKSRFNGSN